MSHHRPSGRISAAAFALLLGVSAPGVLADEPQETPGVADLIAQAKELRSQGQWDEALNLLHQVVDRTEEDRAAAAAAQVLIGKYLFDRGEVAAGQGALELVSQLFADQPE